MSDIHSIADEISQSFRYCVLFFISETKAKKTFESIGSCFCIRHDSEDYIITAKHVLDEMKCRFEDGFSVILSGPFNAIEINFKNIRGAAGCDLAVIASRDIEGFEKLKGLSPKSIDFDASYQNPHYAIFLGYPSSSNQFRLDVQPWVKKIFAYDGVVKKVVHYNMDLRSSIHIGFNVNRSFPGLNRPPNSPMAPLPYGISGGPVIGISFEKNTEGEIDWNNYSFGICGICCEHVRATDYKNRGELIAEHIDLAKIAL